MRFRQWIGILMASTAWDSRAGSVALTDGSAGPGLLNIPITSFVERRFKTVLRQQYDFSCGSAALASLLSFHYRDDVGELEVFADMWEHGEREKIQKQGFSMLDMKNYLARRGYKADGFKIGLEQLAAARVPALTIINNKGYLHFIIIKGLSQSSALIGDPALGVKTIDLETFRELWENRILFVIRDKQDIAATHFNDEGEWLLSPKAPLGTAVDNGSLADFNLLQPGRWDF
jgi:predicted double-glycine peptidase